MVKEGATAERVKRMFSVLEMPKSEIARQLGITRQAVGYHLGNKSKRHRRNMPAKQRKAERALALKRYHTKKALEVLE
ncbi:MAG: hypothetical protein ABI067_03555 [Leifsonia sp.]